MSQEDRIELKLESCINEVVSSSCVPSELWFRVHIVYRARLRLDKKSDKLSTQVHEYSIPSGAHD